MNEIQQIDLLERIREFVLGQWSGAEEHLRRLGDTEGASPEREAEALIAALLKTSPVGGQSLRRLHRILTSLENGEPLDPALGLADRQAQRVAESLRALRTLQEEHGTAAQWARGMDGAAELHTASRQMIPGLQGQERWRFLRAISPEITVPEKRRVALLVRLGLMRALADETASEVWIEQHHAVQTLGALSSIPMSGVDFLLGALCGAEPGQPDSVALCIRQPLCSQCPVKSLCEYHRHHGDIAPPPRQTMKDIPSEDRPREKLQQQGPAAMSDAELLAIVLRSGGEQQTALDLAQRLLSHFDTVEALAKAGHGELCQIKGIGPAKATEIRAALELGRRSAAPPLRRGDQWQSSEEIYRAIAPRMAGLEHEEFWLLLMDARLRLIRHVAVSRGDLTGTTVHPREIFKEAIRESAAAVIAVHNHPSGDPNPSYEDRMFTEQLVDAGKLLDIRLLDHIVIGTEGYVSFADREWL